MKFQLFACIASIFLIVCISASPVLAQSPTSMSYVHGGLNLSTVRSAFTGLDFNKMNLLLGFGRTIPTDDEHFYFGFEANLAQKGNRTANPTPGVLAEQTRANLLYLQVPGYAGYRFDKHWTAFLGPAIGVLVRSTEENLFTNNKSPTDFRTLELSALIGAKYDFGEHWGMMIRFEHSIFSVVNVEPQLQGVRGARRYHALVGASLYYSF